MYIFDGYDISVMKDGKVMIAVVADAILVYDGANGDMLAKPIRGAHKDTITSIASSKDSKRFATGRYSISTSLVWIRASLFGNTTLMQILKSLPS